MTTRTPSAPGQTLRLVSGGDPGDVVGVEREALALDLDLAAAAQDQEDLLLAVVGVVVLGVVLVAGGQVDHRHPERLDPELGPGPLEGAPGRPPPSRRSSSPRSSLICSSSVWFPPCRRILGDLHERSCFFVP